MMFRLKPAHFALLLGVVVLTFSILGHNTTAADHHWPLAVTTGQPPLRVALTFDDGPNDVATRAIVDILHREHVPATFFEVGRSIIADPATTTYVIDHGFLIGNHTWDHSWSIPTMTHDQIQSELTRTNEVIASITGHAPSLMRWPHGAHSLTDDHTAKELDLRPVYWDVDPQDYNTQDPQLLVSRILASVHDKNIILLHDNMQDGQFAVQFHDRRGTIAALPMIIEQLHLRGAEFLSVPDMLKLKYGPSRQSARL